MNPLKRYVLKLERFPQRDFIERVGFGATQEDAVRTILDDFFATNPTQKVKLKSCIEFIG